VLTRLVIPVFSASAVVGGYVPYILVSSPGAATENISIAVILGIPVLAMVADWYRHRSLSTR
jgi:hypothetical protein